MEAFTGPMVQAFKKVLELSRY